MHNRIVCTCTASPHCGWGYAVSGVELDQMNFRILHICELSPQCGCSCASSSCLLDQMTSYILSKCGASPHCGWACVFSDVQLEQMICGIGHKRVLFLCCGLPCASSRFLLDWMISGILNCCASCLHSWQAYAFQFALVCQGSETLSTVAFVVLYDLTLFPCSAKIIKIWFGTFTCTKFMLNSQLIFSISFIDVSSTDGAAVTCNWFDPESTRT